MNRSSRYHGNRDVVPDVDDYERSAKRRKEDRSVTGSSSGQVIDPQFRTLCLSQFNQRVSDDEITSAIFQEFKKFGEFTVKIIYSGSRRLAYVDFQFADDAFAAKQLFQDKLVMFDTPIRVDVVYSTKPPPPRNRSPSPPDVGRGDGYRRSSPYASRAKEGNGGYDGPREPVAYHDRGPQPRESRYQGHQQQQQQAQIPPEDDETATRTLFVGNLDFNVTAEELQQVFNRFGIVEDVDVKRAAAGSGAYAFIRFFHLDMAYYAKMEMSGRLIGHHQCRIGYGKATPSNCLWVGGIGPWLTPETLGRIFGRHAPVQRVEWPPGMNYAYIQFSTTEDARLAMNAMRGAPLGGQDRRIRIDFADVTQITSPMNIPRNGRRDADPLPPAASRPWPADRREPDPDLDRRTIYDDPRHSTRAEGPDDGPRGSRQYRSTSPDRRGSDRRSSELRPMEPEILDVTNVSELTNKLPVVWSGVFMLKNSAFATRLHLVDGDVRLVDALMRDPSTTERTSLKITQRLRLDDSKLGEVRRRISLAGPSGCAVLLALPSADTGTSADQLNRPLKNLVTYLRQKDAAGVILLPPSSGSGSGRSSHRDSGLLHAFPPCDFARQQLTRRAPRLSTGSQTADDYLVVIVVRLNS